jgi:hypothetical protein
LREEDPDQRGRIIKSVDDQFFPEYGQAMRRIVTKGHNPTQLADAQKRFIKTSATIWDVVNELTWIGSHQSAFNFTDSKRFKVEGGNLFSKTWDLEHADLASI